MSEVETTQEYDEYGFLIGDEETDGSSQERCTNERCHSYSAQPSEEVESQWTCVLNSWHDSTHQVKQLLRKGLPRSLRSKAWQLFLGTQSLREQSDFNYQAKLSELLAQLSDIGVSEFSTEQDIRTLNHRLEQPLTTVEEEIECVEFKTLRQIMLDIGRSFPSHRLFMTEEAACRPPLLRILALYAAYNPRVGYCQGMAYVGGLLLMSMEEGDAFWALVSLCENTKYLSGYYDASMSKLHTHADVFALVLREKLPDLANHLDELGIHPLLYLTPWFMCLFTSLPCWDTVLALCDLLFLEGIHSIFSIALAIMKVCAPELLAMYRLDQALPLLQHLPSRLVAQGHLLPALWRTALTQYEVERHLDTVHQQSGAGRRTVSRKRPVPADTIEAESPRPAKRRRGAQTPAASTKPSLLTRIVNAFTPGKTPLARQRAAVQTPASLNNLSTPHHRASLAPSRRKRKRDSDNDENFDLSIRTPCIQESYSIELTDFTACSGNNTPPSRLLADSSSSIGSPLPCLHSLLESNRSPLSPLVSSPRRSVRIAKRRSTCQQVASPLSVVLTSPATTEPIPEV